MCTNDIWHVIKYHVDIFKFFVAFFFCLSCKLFRQLDDASRSVFKENVRLNEALKYHIKAAEDLEKLTNSLAKENASLALDKVCLNHRTVNSSVAIRYLHLLVRDHSSP